MSCIEIIDYKDLNDDFFKFRKIGTDVHAKVQEIVNGVQDTGDKKIHEISALFDKANPDTFEIPQNEIELCANNLKVTNPALFEAATYSFNLALEFAKKQRACFTDFEAELTPGLITGQKTIPVEKIGLYAPAGRFPLLSSLIMCAAPAIASGASEIILCTPPQLHPDAKGDKTSIAAKKPWADEGILAAAYICGIKRIFAIGGAQAIAAMAYGTQSVPRVDVVAGPGNKFVAEAKRIVFGQTGIDIIAGPTEAFIIADDTAKPAWVAADMLAQAEHDADAQAILVTQSRTLAQKVATELENQLSTLPTAQTASASLKTNGRIIIVTSLSEAADIANKKAPEHLEIAMDAGKDQDFILANTHNYGTLFVGHEAAEVFGDYAAGLDHILPTTGNARFTGGLSVRHFLKTVTTLRAEKEKTGLNKTGFIKSVECAGVLGDTEGLAAHARAARIRLD